MKKYLLFGIAAVVCVTLVTAAISYGHIRANMPIDTAPAISIAAQGDTVAAQKATSTKQAGIDFLLSAGEQDYHGTVQAGSTVLDAMESLEAGGAFRFMSKEFSGMGAFIESINGKTNSNGFYWILYVNGTPSQIGVSQTHVRAGDSLEWRYEQGY